MRRSIGRTGTVLAVVSIAFVLAASPVLASVTIGEFGTPTANSGAAGHRFGT
jgi:archaellin